MTDLTLNPAVAGQPVGEDAAQTRYAKHKAVVRRLYDEALNQGRYEQVVNEVATADAVVNDGLGRGGTGPEAITGTMRALHAGFSDLLFVIDDILADGDRVVVRWHMTGSHTGQFAGQVPTGRDVTQRAFVMYRLTNGRVAEVWPLVDRLGLMQQLTDHEHPRPAPANVPAGTAGTP